jgi:hypothetical protein
MMKPQIRTIVSTAFMQLVARRAPSAKPHRSRSPNLVHLPAPLRRAFRRDVDTPNRNDHSRLRRKIQPFKRLQDAPVPDGAKLAGFIKHRFIIERSGSNLAIAYFAKK